MLILGLQGVITHTETKNSKKLRNLHIDFYYLLLSGAIKVHTCGEYKICFRAYHSLIAETLISILLYHSSAKTKQKKYLNKCLIY